MRPLHIPIEIGCLAATLGCVDSDGREVQREESVLAASLNYSEAGHSRMRILIRCKFRNASCIAADILPSALLD